MSEEMQALCFYAGVNAMYVGEKILTTRTPNLGEDMKMLLNLELQLKKEEVLV